jgi:hypothetical protein
MNAQAIVFKNVAHGIFLIKNTKGLVFWEFFLDVIFKNTSNANQPDFFYK